MSESNVDDVDRQKPCLRGTTATDEMPENGYFERQKLSEKNEEQLCKSDVEFERENVSSKKWLPTIGKKDFANN